MKKSINKIYEKYWFSPVKISVKYIRLDKIIFTRNINVIIPKLTSA